jgi:D-alanyl-lipoteichoic acid acyltransferase DltB (MBOAT superfamily)
VVIADSLGDFAAPVFNAAETDQPITFFDGWGGVLSYTFQIYFDFSGYSDMAVGLSLLFGIRLPLNFNSPYKAQNMVEFWRRWHISLSTFLRDYLYFPLGGNKYGSARRYCNLLVTMILGGLWHGASWNFVLWGALHGAYLALNHAWRDWMVPRLGWSLPALLSWVLTFLCVVVGWVLFRANSLAGALKVYGGLIGKYGVQLPSQVAEIIPYGTRFFAAVGTMPLLGGGTVMGVLEEFVLVTIALIVSKYCPTTWDMRARTRLLVIVFFSGFLWHSIVFFAHPREFLYFQF